MLKGIRSLYILKFLLEYIPKRVFLGLIKYNKDMQNKLNIHLEDYRIYNQIKIEIIPIK